MLKPHSSGLVLLVATLVAAVVLWRDPRVPRPVATSILAAVPNGIGAAALGAPMFVFAPIVALATAGSALVLDRRLHPPSPT